MSTKLYDVEGVDHPLRLSAEHAEAIGATPHEPEPLDVQGKALTDMTVAELKEIVAAAGMETTATKKADLIAAIAAHEPQA